jgi:hypothetical protein
MNRFLVLLVLVVTGAITASAENNASTRRDDALRNIDVCLRTSDVSTRECKRMNQSINALISAYNSGDRSVLPTLLRFPYLTNFFDKALLADPQAFLAAVGDLPDKQQSAVARGVAGGVFWLRDQATLQRLMDLLQAVPHDSTTRPVADRFLDALKTNNACHLMNYFPPRTFTSRSAAFENFRFSRDLYALGQQPLWPPSAAVSQTYRFTRLGAFTGPETATLTVLPDGSATISMKALTVSRDDVEIDDPGPVGADQVTQFLSAIHQVDYWHMATETRGSSAEDGAEWILEGVQNGEYHVVVRWCPGSGSDDAQGKAFANAAKLLLEFAGHKHRGGC